MSKRVVTSVVDDIFYVQILTVTSETENCFDLGFIKNIYQLNSNSESFNYNQGVENMSRLSQNKINNVINGFDSATNHIHQNDLH